MEKRNYFILLLLLFTVNGWGQMPVSSPEESAKKKEINSIKLNGGAFYSDKYHEVPADEAGMEEAHKRSKELLQAHVIEIFSKRLKMSREDVQEIWAVIEKNSQNIVVKRGDMFRVFTYVMKNAFGGGGNELADNITPTPVPEPTPKSQPEPTPQPQPEPKPQPLPEPKQEPKADSTVVVAPKPIVEQEQPVKPVPEPQPVPQPEPKVDSVAVVVPKPEPKPEPEVAVEIPTLCQTMISKGNFDKVYRFLMQEKAYQKLMYGTAKTMQYPERCYIVLTDKATGSIVAVLDKGQSERMNFVTKKMDHFRNYQGGNYKAIFVQEY